MTRNSNIGFLISILLLCVFASAQTPVTPIIQPHMTFVDASGVACSLCKVYSYVGGTTTPLATYTDSTGIPQNTNPIVLDIAGGANIWLSQTGVYKFVLVSFAGATIWTVDNVKTTSGGLPCAIPFTVQYSNPAGTALACDSQITINPVAHSLNVGGSIVGSAFTLRNLASIPAAWTLDITTPLTTLTSISPVPLNLLSTQASDTVIMNASASIGTPTAVAMPAGCTLGINYSTASHTWACAASTVPLANIAAQAADSVVMNATAGSAAPTAVILPAGCTVGSNYSTSTHLWTCVAIGAGVVTNYAGRTPGVTSYQNTGTRSLFVSVTYSIPSSGTLTMYLNSFPSPSTVTAQSGSSGGTGSHQVTCIVPPNYYYSVSTDTGGTTVAWSETTL